MSQDPCREIQKQCFRCEKHWGKINRAMKDIGLPDFGTPDNFIDLCDIVKSHAKKDSWWVEELVKMTDVVPGQVQRFMEHPIRARIVLHQLNSIMVKYQMHAMDIKGIHAAPTEQHRFPWAQTCDDLFISWSEYEKIHPFKELS
jgi:hypothetical protein